MFEGEKMLVTKLENNIKTYCLKNQTDFNIKQILECGQCFRWKKIDDTNYIGVIKEGVLRVKQLENEIEKTKQAKKGRSY